MPPRSNAKGNSVLFLDLRQHWYRQGNGCFGCHLNNCHGYGRWFCPREILRQYSTEARVFSRRVCAYWKHRALEFLVQIVQHCEDLILPCGCIMPIKDLFQADAGDAKDSGNRQA